jgi:hypothetical protein
MKAIDRTERSNQHEREFKNWVKSKKVNVLQDSAETGLKVGDIVTFTNDYGVQFKGMKVLGFCKPDNGRCVYISSDCYWFPERPESLKKEL